MIRLDSSPPDSWGPELCEFWAKACVSARVAPWPLRWVGGKRGFVAVGVGVSPALLLWSMEGDVPPHGVIDDMGDRAIYWVAIGWARYILAWFGPAGAPVAMSLNRFGKAGLLIRPKAIGAEVGRLSLSQKMAGWDVACLADPCAGALKLLRALGARDPRAALCRVKF